MTWLIWTLIACWLVVSFGCGCVIAAMSRETERSVRAREAIGRLMAADDERVA